MLTIACVLKSGGDYQPEHVTALREGVAQNLSLPHRFVCLTDMLVDCERIVLRDGWPGWWAKISLFRPGQSDGPIVYFDLDTIIVGSLDGIVLGHRFTVLQNFWADAYKEPDRIGSGMMAWNADLSAIYHAFAKRPQAHMAAYKTKERWGDQAFIKDHVPLPMDRWQWKHPGKVVSFKKHVLQNRGVPEGASVCCFHGRPRPWALPAYQRAWFSQKQNAA